MLFSRHTRRREFITLLGGASVAWPLVGRAQQPAMPVIGFLRSTSSDGAEHLVAAFRRGLGETGYVEGQNVTIDYRWAEGHYERLSELASDLVGVRVAVIFAAGGPPSVVAAKAATSTIPIVFPGAGDPVHLGLVKSLNRPGGNVTGVSTLSTELAAKSVEVLKEMVPNAATVAYLINPSNPAGKIVSKEAQAATSRLGLELHLLEASTVEQLDEAFGSLSKMRVTALAVTGEPFFDSQRDLIVALSLRYKLAGCYPWREYVLAGGLMSYGTDLPESYRQAATYVGRILKGEKPADLPVMQPTKFALAINLKTAKALGLEVPATLLARADEVIE